MRVEECEAVLNVHTQLATFSDPDPLKYPTLLTSALSSGLRLAQGL